MDDRTFPRSRGLAARWLGGAVAGFGALVTIIGLGMIAVPEKDATRGDGVGVVFLSLIFVVPGAWIWWLGKVKQRQADLEDAVVRFAAPRGRIRLSDLVQALGVSEREAERLTEAAIARRELDFIFLPEDREYVARDALDQPSTALRCEVCNAPAPSGLQAAVEVRRCAYCDAILRVA